MSFLLGGEYSCSSSESDAEEPAVPVEKPEADDENKESKQLLPSPESILSSVKASFLPSEAVLKQRQRLKEEQEKQRLQEQQQAEEQRAKEEQQEQERKESERLAAERARKRPLPTEAARSKQPAKKDKKDAKERVKKQRTKGQAGIGSDFRGWKSETEMKMRQQFD